MNSGSFVAATTGSVSHAATGGDAHQPQLLRMHLTRLVGREREIASVQQLVAASRLVTITGAGGSGKTRIALEVARLIGERGTMPVAWVELAPVQDASQIGPQVVAALGIRDEAKGSVLETLTQVLADRSVLVVLDNCEHVVAGCAAFVDALLRRCAAVRVLATSREALGIGGERSWLAPVLSLPAAPARDAAATKTDVITAARASESEAVQLFVQRAQDVMPAFRLTDQNADVIAAICRRVDGLPLAIELAAARIRVLAPEQIAARLDDAFRVLAGGPRTALPRHRTLREAIGWSVRLLDAPEAMLLSRLSVFAGDFALDMAERVCSDDALPADEVLDRLSALVDKSLVVMHESDGAARYALLETIRQFAAEALVHEGTHSHWMARHAAAYAERVVELEPAYITPGRAAAVAALAPDIDQLRAALRWTRENDGAMHVRIAGSLPWFWYSLGLWSEGRRWLEGALGLPAADAPTRDRAEVLFGAGAIAALQADNAIARAWLEESMSLATQHGDDRLAAYASNYLCMAFAGQGLADGERHGRAALAWFEATGDLYGQRLALLLLATSRMLTSDLESAAEYGLDAVRVARRFGVDRELGIALQVYGTILFQRGDLHAAEQNMYEALECLHRDPQPLFVARAVDVLALIATRRGDVYRAIRLFGAASAERELIGASLFVLDRQRLAPHIAAARDQVGDEAFTRAWEEGRVARIASVVSEVLESGFTHAASSASAPVPASPVAFVRALDGDEVDGHGLFIRALGRLRISRDGAEIPTDAWRSARPRELLVYLAMHPGGRTREQIGLTFWPDASPAAVKNNFHVTLHHMRKALGASDWIVYEGDRYRVNAARGVRIDALELETGMREAYSQLRAALRPAGRTATHTPDLDDLNALRRLLERYDGDFLADESAGDWHLEHRDALRRLYTDTLRAAGAVFERNGAHESAAAMYRRLVAAEPFDEDGYRDLIGALAASGSRTEALRQYDRLVTLLASEFDATPSPETLAVRDRITRA